MRTHGQREEHHTPGPVGRKEARGGIALGEIPKMQFKKEKKKCHPSRFQGRGLEICLF